jgi:RNA polymerase sigma-70 factor (ECF subfamily)
LPPTDPRSDAELVAALNRGDLSAFDALYYRHRDWVVRLAARFAGNDADALDVLQETFSYLLRKGPGLRLTAAMTTFLYPVVKHLSLAAKRKRMRQPTLSAISQPDDSERTSEPTQASADQPDAQSIRSELSAVLAALPETHREVLLLRFVDGLSLQEIAEAMELPVGTVKSRLHNGLATLRSDPRTRAYFGKDDG